MNLIVHYDWKCLKNPAELYISELVVSLCLYTLNKEMNFLKKNFQRVFWYASHFDIGDVYFTMKGRSNSSFQWWSTGIAEKQECWRAVANGE